MVPEDNMSHAEIWDDSALVNSWNDALEEYKKYHSIEARGENVEDVLRKATETGVSDSETGNRLDESNATRPRNSSVPATMEDSSGKGITGTAVFQEQSTSSSKSIPEPDHEHPALPRHLIGQVHDEGLKNLLMSWYYAGYYTGLYEGQQQGQGTKGNLSPGV